MHKQPAVIKPELTSNDTDNAMASASAGAALSAVGRQKWKILLFMFVCAAGVGMFANRLQPVYEATATLSIEHPGASAVIGQDGYAGPVNDMDQLIMTHIENLQSEAVVRSVASEYHLLEAEGQLKGKTAEERAKIEAAPVSLTKLKVTRPPNTYLLRVSYRAHDPNLAADVSNGIAQAYVERSAEAQMQVSVDRAQVMQHELAAVKAKLDKSEAALSQFETKLGLSSDARTTFPEGRFGQLSSQVSAAQEERIRKEEALHAMLSSAAGTQLTAQNDALTRALQRLADARQKFAQAKAVYGSTHPEYRKAANEVNETNAQVEEIRALAAKRTESEYNQALAREQALTQLMQKARAEFEDSNPARHRYNQMKRELENDKQLYDDLTRRLKEHEINGAFRHGMARLSNRALPPAIPVFPNKTLLVAIALIAACLFAVGGVILFDAFDQSLLDPEQAAHSLKVNFLGTLPELTKAAASLRLTQVSAKKSTHRSLTNYEEAVRTVRNTLSSIDFNGEHRTIMFTSTLPSEGKSTTVTHLGRAFARHGKRTLIIDADLRRPSIHKQLGVQSKLGLTGVLEDRYSWRDAVTEVSTVRNLSLLAAGTTTLRPSDLVTDDIATLLEEAAHEFDLVLVDAPPLLGFAETLQIGTAVDAVVLVTQAGRTPGKLVGNAIANLRRVRVNVLGLLVNRAPVGSQPYGYGYSECKFSQAQIEHALPVLDKTA